MHDVSAFRLNLLRALYLLIAVGLGLVVWPGIVQHVYPVRHAQPWELMDGVVQCMLGAFALLSVLGLRYPLQLLPVLLWELLWKCLWLLVVALPLWLSGQMDAATWQVASSVLLVAIFPFVIPWRYVLQHYVQKTGERWRTAS